MLSGVVLVLSVFFINSWNEQFLSKWDEIYQKGHQCLLRCSKHFGNRVHEEFSQFVDGLKQQPPTEPIGTTQNQAKELGPPQ